VLEIDVSEVALRVRRATSLWAEVIRDGITVHGSPLEELRGRGSAFAKPHPTGDAAQARAYVSKGRGDRGVADVARNARALGADGAG